MVSFIDFFFRPLFSGLERTPDRPAPQAFNIIQDPKQTLALPAFFERIRQSTVVKPMLQSQIKVFELFKKRTFNTNPRKPPTSRAARFQPLPKGSRFAINPFTGQRIALPVGRRGSSVTESFFGGKALLASNLNLVTQGNLFLKSINASIKALQDRIRIIDTNSV